ncbi:MAG: nucleotidyltransferase domain-containing protein [Eubacteriales bacterium]|nr:nucleotidyltransferase domain-containing protein [Eubacteriales bacterium]
MAYELALNEKIIQAVKEEVVRLVTDLLGKDLVEVILYGSCARGDYTSDSDIDIALITRSNRLAAKKYASELAGIATELAMKYFAIVNFVCLPYEEYVSKNTWYDYFRNIKEEGEVLYGQRIL